MTARQVIGTIVGLIGIGMIATFWGAWPPVLSGTAFILLGAATFLPK